MVNGGSRVTVFLLGIVSAGILLSAQTRSTGSFQKDVQPILAETCRTCHNDKLTSGNLDLTPFLDPASLISNREGWERILTKVRAGEMPPKNMARPAPEKINALVAYLDGEFDRLDRSAPPDPGRVAAHRLNRNEYANTIRDLLAVDVRADEEFPADDSGYGFDNIGDVLTVSPTLMERYIAVAERIARRAVGGDPLPKAGFFSRKDLIKRIDADTIQLREAIEYDAEYIVRVNITGYRPNEQRPVTLVISVDGKEAKTVSLPVGISAVNRQGGATQRAIEEVRVFLEANDHVFRAQFVNDEALAAIPENQQFNNSRNIYPDTIEVAGPFPVDNAQPVKKKILVCDPASGNPCVERILSETARRAYRRPVTKSDVADLKRVFDRAAAVGYNPRQSLQFAVTAMLVSPDFLFRIERDPKPGTTARIRDNELASRLSYFLWSSMPDDELLSLAEKNRLHETAVLDAQVKRMIASPKSSAFAENFAGQWLETRSLDAVKPDAKKFPEWNSDLRDAMRTETRMFFEAVMREDRPISDFIDGKFTFLNEQLAKHYGLQGVVTGSGFQRVQLDDKSRRSGVFTQGSVLTVSSYPTRTSVVLRGKYLLENVLNAPPPPPPPNVPPLNEASVGVEKTLRQQMEQHRDNPVCASCHARMDPLGFALENYDAVGKWRTRDGKFEVDPGGTFPNGKTFAGPEEMKALLKENLPEFARSLTEKMLTYSLGRGVESYDRTTVKELVARVSANGYKFQSLITGIVQSVPFQQRRRERSEREPDRAKPSSKVKETSSK